LSSIDTILVIIQRSNGDVYYSFSLIEALKEVFPNSSIDILVNEDTYQVSNLYGGVSNIIQFSYKKKHSEGVSYLVNFARKIFKKYDISINLTSSDRSVLFSILSARRSYSVIERYLSKSWWKRLLLTNFLEYDKDKHILVEYFDLLKIIGYEKNVNFHGPKPEKSSNDLVQKIIDPLNNNGYIIFHPCAQYSYKILPINLINEILEKLSTLGIDILITGSGNDLDMKISRSLKEYKNTYNLIGKTSLNDFLALSNQSLGYIGMDTLNMHISASQGKKIFAIFGPTNKQRWMPWSDALGNFNNLLKTNNKWIYKNVTIYSSTLPCMPCGKAGCDDRHGQSICLTSIDVSKIFYEIKIWLKDELV